MLLTTCATPIRLEVVMRGSAMVKLGRRELEHSCPIPALKLIDGCFRRCPVEFNCGNWRIYSAKQNEFYRGLKLHINIDQV